MKDWIMEIVEWLSEDIVIGFPLSFLVRSILSLLFFAWLSAIGLAIVSIIIFNFIQILS